METKEAIEKLNDWIEYLSDRREGAYKLVELEYEDALEIIKMINNKDETIHRLECCGNCKHWDESEICFHEPPFYRNPRRYSKCKEWEFK